MKKTAKKKANKKIGKVNPVLYAILYPIFKRKYTKKYHITFDKEIVKEIKGPAIVVASHTCDMDHILSALTLYPVRPTYIVSEHFIHNPATAKFMKLMHVDEYAERLPERLSGGQQQRVALARALCIEPDVLLFDEPLSNLDAKLRVEMRTVIKQIQHNVGITTVYVTHDQEEAMAVSDRIAVMKDGVIQHVGTPKNIYQRPSNLFVSTFIGRSNVLKDQKLVVEDGKTYIVTTSGYKAELNNVLPEYQKDQDIILSVRPEEFLLNRDTSAEGITATVDDCVFLGLMTHYFVHLESGEEVEIIQESSIDSIIEPGTKIKLTLNTDKVNVFNADGSANILTGVQNDCANA